MQESPQSGPTLSFQHPLLEQLTNTAIRLYVALQEVAYEVADRRGYQAIPTQVSFFVPLEAVALALGVNRSTIYRNLPCLREAGLVDQRGHFTTIEGQTRADGSVWAIKLDPLHPGRARLHHEDLTAQYRNLAADISVGHTVYQEMQQSKRTKEYRGEAEVILEWVSLPPAHKKTPIPLTVAAADLEAVLDVPHVPKAARNEAVDSTARICAGHLGDTTNLNFYRWLLWQALRLWQQDQDCFYAVYLQLKRAGTDRAEGFARNPGALFVSRLKQMECWEPLRSVTPVRVGKAPG